MNRSLYRSMIYTILSLCYNYPDEKVCSWIAEGEWIRRLRESLNVLTDGSFEKWLQPFENLFAFEEEEFSLNMAREYTRLFIHAFPHVVAPPYGSIYLEKDGQGYGRTTSEVLRFYQERSFTLKEDLKDPPDHIAHELEFMGILADQEGQTSGSEKIKLEEIQMDFFCRFILPWITSFCAKIVEHSLFPFYQYLGDLTREFIDFEKNYLGVPEEGPVMEVGQTSQAGV